MNRPYAAKRLLEHGPLTFREFLEITRWPYRIAQAVLTRLMEAGTVEADKVSSHRNSYRLAE